MHRRHSLASTSGPEAHLEGLPLTPLSRPGNLNAMTLTNSFIAELIRDANRLDHLDDYQKRRMLERAVTTIRDIREAIGIPSGSGRDCLLDLHTVALSIDRGWRGDEDVRSALLQAAGMIRDLHIVLDSKTEISLVKPAS